MRVKVNADSLTTNLLVTGLVLVLVFLLPWVDRRVCRRLGLNLQGGISTHPRAASLLRTRLILLWTLFGIYVSVLAYLVFFSRTATEDYQVHVALFEDLKKSVYIDFGFLEVLRIMARDGFRAGLSHIRVINAADITQVYLNVMLFVPLGYLLPYVSGWMRRRVWVRPVVTCFLVSLLIENLQLIARRGFYDLDDLVSNTAGGLIGQALFIGAAYVVTHPNWRKELRQYRRWKRNAKARTLYPFARRMTLARTTLLATSEEDVWDFYVMKLGFRLMSQIVRMDSPGTDMLLEMGKTQVEIHCTNLQETLPRQSLTIAVRRLSPVIRRLQENGIKVSAPDQDPYTGLRCVHFEGPDGVCITVIVR